MAVLLFTVLGYVPRALRIMIPRTFFGIARRNNTFIMQKMKNTSDIPFCITMKKLFLTYK